MIVIENETTFEVRDCYLRSMKKETSQANPPKTGEHNGSSNDYSLNHLLSSTYFEIEEVGFWLNGYNMNENSNASN